MVYKTTFLYSKYLSFDGDIMINIIVDFFDCFHRFRVKNKPMQIPRLEFVVGDLVEDKLLLHAWDQYIIGFEIFHFCFNSIQFILCIRDCFQFGVNLIELSLQLISLFLRAFDFNDCLLLLGCDFGSWWGSLEHFFSILFNRIKWFR